MLENYPSYLREACSSVLDAPHNVKVIRNRILIVAIVTVSLTVTLFFGTGVARAETQKQEALAAVASTQEIDSSQMKVAVSGNALSVTSLLEGNPTEELAGYLEEDINGSLQDISSENSKVSIIDKATTSIEYTTQTGTNVTVIMKKDESGKQTIDSVQANVDQSKNAEAANANKSATADQKKALEVSDKEKNASVVGAYNMDKILASIGYSASTGLNEEDLLKEKTAAVEKSMTVLPSGLSMFIPSSFTKSDSSVTDSAGSDGTSQGIIGYYRTANGSTLTVRTEKIDQTLSSLTGKELTQKMKTSWGDVATSVATGAGQSIKNPEKGIEGKIAYLSDADLWHYQGSAILTDGTREITNLRLAFINMKDMTMTTVSYRCDVPIAASETAPTKEVPMTIDALFASVTMAPTDSDALSTAYATMSKDLASKTAAK